MAAIVTAAAPPPGGYPSVGVAGLADVAVAGVEGVGGRCSCDSLAVHTSVMHRVREVGCGSAELAEEEAEEGGTRSEDCRVRF